MRQDQQRIFDTYNQHRGQTDSSNNLSMEIGSIQMQMGRRGLEKKALQEQIAKLNAELGLTGTAEK